MKKIIKLSLIILSLVLFSCSGKEKEKVHDDKFNALKQDYKAQTLDNFFDKIKYTIDLDSVTIANSNFIVDVSLGHDFSLKKDTFNIKLRFKHKEIVCLINLISSKDLFYELLESSKNEQLRSVFNYIIAFKLIKMRKNEVIEFRDDTIDDADYFYLDELPNNVYTIDGELLKYEKTRSPKY